MTLSKDQLLQLYSTLDLTSLNSTDGPVHLQNWLQNTVLGPRSEDLRLTPAAVCVYPNFAQMVRWTLKGSGIPTCVVTGGFPSGQTFREIKIMETEMAIAEGAQEIDMVVSRGLWREPGNEEKVLSEIFDVRMACRQATLKVILENCDLDGDLASIYKLSYLALEAGADFIKTSTGKGTFGAQPHHFGVMCLALSDWRKARNERRGGVKAAGGIQDPRVAWTYVQIAEAILGEKVFPANFRIGASTLAKKIIEEFKSENV